MATPKKITDKIDTLKDLLEAISEELESINWDFVDLEDNEKTQLPKDLAQIKTHLKKTAKLFSHLKGRNAPDWGN